MNNNPCGAGILEADVKEFILSPERAALLPGATEPLIVVPVNPYIQLMNGRDFAKTQPHGKFAFFTSTGQGYCVRGFLLGGNGIFLNPGVNYGYPFHGMAPDINGDAVDLSVFREADDALARVLGGDGYDVMSVNDKSTWFTKEFVIGMFEIAMEDFPLTPEHV